MLSRRSWPASMSPCSREEVNNSCSSTGPWTVVASSTGSTLPRRRTALARPFRASRTGPVTQVKARKGRARSTADRSGWLMAHDFGAISPTTMWRKTTTATAMTTATTEAADSGSRAATSSGVISSATAGLARAPRPRVARVMPSWAPASISESSRLLRTAARAAPLPSAARTSNRWRLADTMANSAATKNPLSTRRATERATEAPTVIELPPPRQGSGRSARG